MLFQLLLSFQLLNFIFQLFLQFSLISPQLIGKTIAVLLILFAHIIHLLSNFGMVLLKRGILHAFIVLQKRGRKKSIRGNLFFGNSVWLINRDVSIQSAVLGYLRRLSIMISLVYLQNSLLCDWLTKIVFDIAPSVSLIDIAVISKFILLLRNFR